MRQRSTAIYFMRRGQRCRSSPLLVLLGLVFGFAVTMCLQSLRCIGAPQPARAAACRRDDVGAAPAESAAPLVAVNWRSPQPLLSPRRQLLLVGVMTAHKFVDSRAWTQWRTWAQFVPGRVIFFVSENAVAEHADLPVVRLPGVDDAYPPQKKSFMMLRWMAEHGLGVFDWFLRADDDLYVRGDKLELLLRSLDPARPLFIGQTGVGNAHEYGQLSLADDENYCMGGPGVLFSHETLRRVGPHLADCLHNMYSEHEDVELGRCVRRHAGVSCTWSYEMQSIFYNNQSGASAYAGDLNSAQIQRAIMLHPLKQPTLMRRLHVQIRSFKSRDLLYRRVQIARDLFSSAQSRHRSLATAGRVPLENDAALSAEWRGLPATMTVSRRSLVAWEFMSASTVLFCADKPTCPRHNVESYQRYALNTVVGQIFDSFNRNARQRGRVLDFQSIQYGYRRVVPQQAAEYVLDMVLLFKKFRGQRATVPVRRHAYIRQNFGALQAVEHGDWLRAQYDQLAAAATAVGAAVAAPSPPPADDADPIYVIVPLAGRSDTFRRFADNLASVGFERRASRPANPVALIVVQFASADVAEDDAIRRHLSDLRARYPDEVIKLVSVADGAFRRGLALSRGAASTPSERSLLFLTDVDLLLTADALLRVRLNTVLRRQVYFPIVFSEYNPQTWSEAGANAPQPSDDVRNHLQYDRRRGYFRHFGFGIAGIYRADLDAVGGMNTDIEGWGLEDVDLFEKCLHHPTLTVLRAPEPLLIHVYHPVFCDASMAEAQLLMCRGSRAASYASVDALAQLVYAQMARNAT